MPAASPEGRGRKPREHGTGASSGTAARENSCPEESRLMEAVVGRENMWRALKRVESNKGAAGVDAMPLSELRGYSDRVSDGVTRALSEAGASE